VEPKSYYPNNVHHVVDVYM